MNWLNQAGECPVLHGIETERLLEVFEQIEFRIKKFRKNDLIAIQGEEVTGLIILLSGSVRGEMTDFSGRMIKIEDVEAPRPLAGAFVFGDENRYPVDVLANCDVNLLIIYRDQLLKLLQLCPTAQINYLNLISTKTQFLSRKIKFLSFKTIKSKLVHYLLQLDHGADGVMHIPVSQQALAELFGAARPSIARVFGQLEEANVLSVKNRQVTIYDKKKLMSYIK